MNRELDLSAPGVAVQVACDFLYREAAHLDAQRWDDWVALFRPDCEFWVPAWKSEHELTSNPRAELSLLFYRNRSGLEERIVRIRTGRSAASSPLPRTHHAITNVQVEVQDATTLQVRSNWTVHEFHTRHQATEMRYGRYEHTLVNREGAWSIQRKFVVIVNDYLPAAVDFYNF